MAIAVVHDTYLKTTSAPTARLGGDVGERGFQSQGRLNRRFSRTLNLPIRHPIFSAVRPIFPGFFSN